MKRALIGNIIDKKYTHRSSIVCSRDRSKALLPSGIPDLQFHPFTV